MAMNASALGKKIADRIVASDAPAEVKTGIENLWKGIATDILDEVKKATISVSAGIPVSITGTPVAQTGATTAPGTASITA